MPCSDRQPQPRPAAFRGLFFATPIALVLWALIAAAARLFGEIIRDAL